MTKWKRLRGKVGVWFSLAVVALLGAAVLLTLPQAPAEIAQGQSVSGGSATVAQEGCELMQTLTYARCSHSVTRRVAAPPEVIGKTLEEVKPLYPDWTITEYGGKEIRMSMNPEMYCPDHMVLMPNAAGLLCVFENRYGDALALVSELETEVGTLPAAYQEEVRRGMGFGSLDELEQWLESAES